MLTFAPLSVVVLGLFGLAVVLAAVARVVVLEHQGAGPVLLIDPGTPERIRSTV